MIHDRYSESRKRYGRLMQAAQKCAEISPRVHIGDAVTSLICQLDGIGVHALISGQHMSPRKLCAQADLWMGRILTRGIGNGKSNVVALADRKRA